jgi:outer membrane receptor protein involved in Fe transport
VRTPFGAAVLLAFAAGLVSPVSAVASPTVIAQAPATQSTISGHVTDSRGNPLPGATVTIEGGGKRYTTTSSSDGSFQQVVSPGLYSVTVNHGGFQSAQNDVATVAGGKSDVAVTLQDVNLSSLRVIGRTGTTAASRNGFNTSEADVSTLPPIEIAIKQNVTLTDTVATMPGVIAQRTFSATPNTSFAVRGAAAQTRVTVDGHPISSGIAGTWNTNYANSLIFGDVEVAKGPGLNGSIAGESAVGTVNLRTRDFSRTNTAGATFGTDSYSGGLYNVWADVNFLANNRASLIVQKAFTGFNGPWGGTTQMRSGSTNLSALPPATGAAPSIIGLSQWTGDFSNNFSLEAELVKLRYRFSESSSVTLEYLGLQGQYQPQGGSYAAYQGNMTLQACQTAGAYQPTLATCVANSTYTAPYTFGQIGSTMPAYTWFPNSYIQNNEPMFAAEFRTAIKNDTVLIRPYTHLINRYISGTWENHYPGNGGGWFAVTNVANCQPVSVNPTQAGGAKGPCFGLAGIGPNSPAYIGAGGMPVQYKTTPTAPTCSPTPPYTCFTTTTGFQNDGTIGFSTPFSQPELDRLNGYTFSWIHPVGDNVFNFSYDYRKDYAQSLTGDTSAAAPGCYYVVGSVSGAVGPTNPALLDQPTCTLAANGGKLPRSPISTPPTVSQYGDFALTGTFQLNPKLRLSLGNYFEIYKLNAQIEDPAVLLYYAQTAPYKNASAAPVALVGRTQSYSHYDPHVGIEFRAAQNLSLRASAGSSITQPWPALVSGFGSVSIPNAAQSNYVNTIPNFALKPETTVVYDAGLDWRLPDGAVVSLGLYDQTIHDVFLSNTSNIGSIPGLCGPGQNSAFPNALCLQTNQVNGPIQRGYGAEFSVTKNPVNGWGYYLSSTLSRTYLDQLPLSIYASNTSANNANFNVSGAQLFGYPFLKAYGQLMYSDLRQNVFEIGSEYMGPNNFTFGQPYVIWDAGARTAIVPKRLRVGVSVQNLLNLNTGTLLSRSLQNQGQIEPTVWLTPTGQLLPGSYGINGNGTTNINALPPRNVRLTLDIMNL